MQTYALCRFLIDQGHDLHIIDIRQEEKTNFGFFGRIAKNLIVSYRLQKDIRNLYPPLTRRYGTLKELQQDPPEADCYIVGSDQVWNPNISKKLMLAYFLDFGKKETMRMSYASSFGLSQWIISDAAINAHIKELLCSFKALSVRERQGQDLCKREFDCVPTIVLDPTFLNADYANIIGKIKPRKEILCYKINKTPDFWEYAPIVSRLKGLPLALLNHNYPKKGYRYCFPPSLKTWMQRIAAAEFVLTDSFHGVAFSIINKKKFVCILNHNDRDSRLINIMTQFHLEDWMFNSVEEMVKDRRWEKEIDYYTVSQHIGELRRESQNYLIEALS